MVAIHGDGVGVMGAMGVVDVLVEFQAFQPGLVGALEEVVLLLVELLVVEEVVVEVGALQDEPARTENWVESGGC